ncbi:MAG: SurA N-terminal domain-containing protein [Patescibacteria group bacterium]|jgi:foldase protein PrsA
MIKTKTSKPKKSVMNKVVRETVVTEPVMPKKNIFAMNPLPKLSPFTYIVGAVVVVVLVGALFFKNLFVVALVNGQPVSRIALIQELERLGGKQALNSLVTKTLIEQEASKKGVKVTDVEINKAVTDLTASLKKQGQDLDKLLVAQGMTKATLIEQMRVQKVVEKLFDKQAVVSDKDVTDYLEKNKESLPEGQDPATLRDSVKDQLKQQKLSEVFQTWVQASEKNAKISYFINF